LNRVYTVWTDLMDEPLGFELSLEDALTFLDHRELELRKTAHRSFDCWITVVDVGVSYPDQPVVHTRTNTEKGDVTITLGH
jgi:hypothetical protein